MRYRLIVTAEGFETWQQDIDLGRGANQYTVRITLTPLNKVKEIPASAPALTDDQAPKTVLLLTILIAFRRAKFVLRTQRVDPATHLFVRNNSAGLDVFETRPDVSEVSFLVV